MGAGCWWLHQHGWALSLFCVDGLLLLGAAVHLPLLLSPVTLVEADFSTNPVTLMFTVPCPISSCCLILSLRPDDPAHHYLQFLCRSIPSPLDMVWLPLAAHDHHVLLIPTPTSSHLLRGVCFLCHLV